MDKDILFVVAVAFSAILAIIGRYSRKKGILYVFKPVTIGLIIFKAATSSPGYGLIYQVLILFGLLVSLVGDIFLMLPGDKFRAGLTSFLAVHIFYAFAFTQNVAVFYWVSLIPVIIVTATIYVLLQKNLGRFHMPVLLYMAVISFMTWQATNRYLNFRDSETMFALLGGILFLISDSILALNKFKRPFKEAQALILTTYYCAQFLIASSF